MIILSERRPRARRAYCCDLGCGEPIAAGEKYWVQASVQDQRVCTFRAHLHCVAASDHDFVESGRWWSGDGFATIGEIDWQAWTRADVDAACDRQGWAPTHPSRERLWALWRRMRGDEPIPQVRRFWFRDDPTYPGTALVWVSS